MLYHICGEAFGEDMSLFVRADRPRNAVRLWQEHYTDWDTDNAELAIRLVPDVAGPIGAIPWEDVPVLLRVRLTSGGVCIIV